MNARPPASAVSIELVLLDHDALALLDEAPADFESAWAIRLGDAAASVHDAAAMTRAMLDAAPRDVPWGAYLVADADTREVVGTCAFKDAPTEAGDVEIAYHTFPGFEGQGYARAMAARLLEIARSAKRVVAHTLTQANASTRVLERLGFVRAGEVHDIDDGALWRWELGARRGGGEARRKPRTKGGEKPAHRAGGGAHPGNRAGHRSRKLRGKSPAR